MGEQDEKAQDSGLVGERTELLGSLHSGQQPTDKVVLEHGAAYLDVSGESERPLRDGEETLLINSSIMTYSYAPHQAAWLVDLDLPRAETDS
jgi:hypothetical protein